MKGHARYNELCAVLLVFLSIYVLCSIQIAVVVDSPYGVSGTNLRTIVNGPASIVVHRPVSIATRSLQQQQQQKQQQQQQLQHHAENGRPSRVLIIAAAPRSVKHIVALWSSLECFTADVDHVVVSAPTWSQPILERVLEEARAKIPRFASSTATDAAVSLEGMVTLNDRYDVGLWCDALSQLGMGGVEGRPRAEPHNNNNQQNGVGSSPLSLSLASSLSSYDEIALLNDSIYALREYTEIFRALGANNASMTSLNYSFIHPKGTGDERYWLESVWRGFDTSGIKTFVERSCKSADDPLFCPHAWWGRKGCIVENFERAMARHFTRDKTMGLFPSDVPKAMLTRTDSFPSWVRHVPYWNKLVAEQDFPVSKVNWEGMIDSIDDDRLQPCTQHLNRSWLLEGFDFSIAKTAI